MPVNTQVEGQVAVRLTTMDFRGENRWRFKFREPLTESMVFGVDTR